MVTSADRQEARSAATSHFTDRCMAIIDGNFMAPRCGLKLGHDGPHEPIKVGKQTVSESPAASVPRSIKVGPISFDYDGRWEMYVAPGETVAGMIEEVTPEKWAAFVRAVFDSGVDPDV